MPKHDPPRRRSYTHGPHLLRPRNGWHYAYIDSARPRVALGTQCAVTARRLLGELLDGRRPSGLDQGPEELTLAAIAQRYIVAHEKHWTPRSKRSSAERALAFVEYCERAGITKPAQFTGEARDAWCRARSERVKRATLNREVVVVRKMLSWAASKEQQLCRPVEAFSDWRAPKEPRRLPPPVIPSPRELARAIERMVADEDHGGAYYLATILATGLRIDEVRHLRASDVFAGGLQLSPVALGQNVADGEWATKSHRARRVPLSPHVVETVRRFLRWRDDGGWCLSDQWAGDVCDRAARHAGIPPFRSHDVRRTFATECRRSGVDLLVIQRWMGHQDSATTERYFGVYREDAGAVAPTPAALSVLMPDDTRPLPTGRRRAT
jgi:integrase